MYISEICAPTGLCQFCYITVMKMKGPNPWQCCFFPTIQGHPDEAWLTHQLNFRGCPEAPWKDQCSAAVPCFRQSCHEFVQFSRPLALQDFVFLQSGLVQLNPVGESLPSDCNQGTKISGAPSVGSGLSW